MHVEKVPVSSLRSGAGEKAEDSLSPRQVICLDQDWKFFCGDPEQAQARDHDDRSWQDVCLPHDYVVEGPFDPDPQAGVAPDWYFLHGCLRIQPAWYRRVLTVDPALKGKVVRIIFDGVFSRSQVWLNGHPLGGCHSGYTSFQFDLTVMIDWNKENVLALRVDPEYDGWWYEGGGIYRSVRLEVLEPLHFAPWGIHVDAVVEDPGDGVKADALVRVFAELVNSSPRELTAELVAEVLDESGAVIASALVSGRPVRYGDAGGENLTFTLDLDLPRAALWSLENPALYRMRTTLLQDGKVMDQVSTAFGARHLRFDKDEGFFLNGRHVKIQGVNCHQDHGGLGVALPEDIIRWRLERLKEMGCNAYRLSHNPVAPVTLDLCDRLGILVIAENRHLGDTYADQTSPETRAVEHRDLSALIKRDRNHPCIILWSLCNEQWIQGTPEAAAMARAMKARIRELDPSRLVTAALNGGFDTPEGLISVLDVVGINYNPQVYDQVHRQFPDKPLLASEIASEVSTRGCYELEAWENYRGNRTAGHLAAWSINAGPGGQVVEKAWPPVADRKFMAGGFVWSGFDYKGEPRPFQWPCINSHYGIMDICGFPKDSYHYYKAWWTDQDVLHILPHWTWPSREGQKIPVWVHSNAQEVELFLNGRSLGCKTMPALGHLEWEVKYQPGVLSARGNRQGRSLETRVQTAGQAAKIRLWEESSDGYGSPQAVRVVNLEVLDAQGVVVPDAAVPVTFRVEGPGRILGTGNGDPSCHVPDHSCTRPVFHGLAQAVIRISEVAGTEPGTELAKQHVGTELAGTVLVRAESPGLEAGVLKLESKAQTRKHR